MTQEVVKLGKPMTPLLPDSISIAIISILIILGLAAAAFVFAIAFSILRSKVSSFKLWGLNIKFKDRDGNKNIDP
ncbi:MAG TPA: hypothetical protein DCR93_37355 [Cytophagales bacterium]|nr:hypothetical protein [Cytophagales bacterium]HAP64918.1 hypothetical protein [Cytophagales bacterium]